MKCFRLFVLILLLFNFIINPVFAMKGSSTSATVFTPTSGGVKSQNIKKHDIKKRKKKLNRYNKNCPENITNNAPKTFEEYVQMSVEKKRSAITIPEPVYEKDPKIIDLPDPSLRIVKYNIPAGSQDLNLTTLLSNRKVNSIGVLSPDLSKIVYTSVVFYPSQEQVSSDVFLINLPPQSNDNSYNFAEDIKKRLKFAHEINRERTPLLSEKFHISETEAMKSFVIVDWSSDSKKIAFKEKIGSTQKGIWQTNLWVYDFESQKARRLNEVREAVRYWWLTNKNIDLIDYMWDIFPVGWDSINSNQIIVYAYAYTDSAPKFLGTWSVDCQGANSHLLSLERTDFAITTSGYILKSIIRD